MKRLACRWKKHPQIAHRKCVSAADTLRRKCLVAHKHYEYMLIRIVAQTFACRRGNDKHGLQADDTVGFSSPPFETERAGLGAPGSFS